MRKIIILFCFLFAYFMGYSQIQKDNQFNSWYTYSGNHKLDPNLSIYTLYSARRSDFVKNWQQSLLRLGINYKLKDNFIVTLGYDWVVTFPYGKQPIAQKTTEHRIFEQPIVKNSVGILKLVHRYKLEQRFIKLNSSFLSIHRIRYRFTINVPLNKKKMTDKTIYMSAFDEVFLNYGKGIGTHYFDQNWAFVGIGYQINHKSKISLGYMNQFLPKLDNVRIENNHTLSVGISHNLDFSKQ